MEIQLTSTITCPNCGHTKEEQMPLKSCAFFSNVKTVKRSYVPKKVTAACIVPTGRMPALLYRRRNPVAESWHQKTFYIECFICLCSMDQELKTEAPRKLILEKSFLQFY